MDPYSVAHETNISILIVALRKSTWLASFDQYAMAWFCWLFIIREGNIPHVLVILIATMNG